MHLICFTSFLHFLFLFLLFSPQFSVAQNEDCNSHTTKCDIEKVPLHFLFRFTFTDQSGFFQKEHQPILCILEQEKLTGDWWGGRDMLLGAGLTIDFDYKGDVFSNITGGVRRGTEFLDNIDLVFTNDLEKMIGLSGTSLLVHFLGNSGGAPSELTGALQGITNIEAFNTWKLYQLHVESKLFADRFSVLIGLYDLNSEFDSKESSSLFINPSYGIGPDFAFSGINGPSVFPTTSFGIRLKFQSESGFYLQSALLDGVPGDPNNPAGTQVSLFKEDGFLLATETGIVVEDDGGQDAKIGFGGWLYTNGFETYNINANFALNPSVTYSYGVYLNGENRLYSNPGNPENNIVGFLRVGIANAEINPVNFYTGCGIVISDMLASGDRFGIAVAYAHVSEYFRKTTGFFAGETVNEYELILEGTYSFRITPWLHIQPDIQWVVNPAFIISRSNSLVFGSRLLINL